MTQLKRCKQLMTGALLACCAGAAGAHGIAADAAKFEQIYARKDPASGQAREARAAMARAQATYAYYESTTQLHMRELLAAGFKAIGGQQASIANEIVRLEAALAKADAVDPAKLDSARKLLTQVRAEKATSDALHDYFGEQMAQALKLIDSAP